VKRVAAADFTAHNQVEKKRKKETEADAKAEAKAEATEAAFVGYANSKPKF
jgi:hypothetical protein